MSESPKQSTKTRPYLDAAFLNARLVSETVTSAPARLAPPNKGSQVNINTQTGSNFTLGLDDREKPTALLVQIEYKVTHSSEDQKRELVSYQATHAAQFKILAKFGFDDWSSPPTSALAPYLAVVQSIAMKRADHTFIDMGLVGVTLPVPTEFADPAFAPLSLTKAEAL